MPSRPDRDKAQRQILLVADSARELVQQRHLIQTLQEQGLLLHTAFVGDAGLTPRPRAVSRPDTPLERAGARAPDLLPEPHPLAASRTPSRLRGVVLDAIAPVSSPHRRVLRAARFDPWFRRRVREVSDVVTLGQQGSALDQATREFCTDVRLHRGVEGLEKLARDVVRRRFLDALGRVGELDQGKQLPDVLYERLIQALAASASILPAEEFPQPLLGQLLALPGRTRDPARVRALASHVRRVLQRDDPVLSAYLARCDLDEHAATEANPATVAADLLTATEPYLEEDPDRAVPWVCLALEVLFHRELHSDSLDAPLTRDPASYLAPVRATRVWQLLAGATDPPPHSPAHDPAAEPHAREPARLRAVLMPGSYGSFFKPVAKALRTTGAVDLQVVPRSTLRPHLRTMGVSAAVVRARLQAALGGPFTGYQELVSVLQGPAPDVVFLDWADKSAVLATLILPPHVRVVLRVHGVDTLRPWIHLLNWSRVDAVVCVSPALQQLVQDVVGEPAREIAVHVIPHIVNLDPLDEAVQGQRNPRLLCMVGWAQRVKDPIWALEVLSALREDGEDWRLLFLGADFAESATASGRAYAAAFRERAKADDVRDHLSFAGFVEDLAPELAKAGFVLSSSLRETWGVGLAEAVAAGAVPVVRDWPMLASRGAARGLYDEPFVVSTVEEAAELVRSLSEEQLRADAARAARDRLRQVADRVETTTQLRRVVLGDLGRLADLSLAGRHDEALTLVHALLEEAASTPALLHQAAISAAMAGEPTLQLQVLQRWLEVDPSDHVGRMVQAQKGRVLELTPGWRPALSPAWGGDDRDAPLGPRQPGEPDRVLHLLKASLPHRSSGYTMRSAYLLGEQARAGLDVVAVTQLDFPPAGRDQGVAAARPGEEVVNGVRHLRLSRENIPEHEPLDAYHAACAAALREVVRAEQPTVIHAHSGHRGYDLAMTAMAVGRATGIPVVYEVRGFFEALWTTDLAQAENAELYRLRWAAEAWCMREAAAVTTLSESMRQDIVQRPGVDPGRVFVVPNGVDPEAITPRGRRPDLVARHGLTDAFVFGYVSNLDHAREGQELLIEAVAGLRDRGLRVKALIVGDGKRSGELKELARRRGVEGDVIFTGHVPHQEVGDYYALLDVFVVPRIDERAARLVTPLKPYEAMAMQLPVVVADLPALLEIVGEDRRGLSFPAGDAKSLTEVLAKLAAGPQLRANLARQGWEWVLANRSWRAAAARYREVYDLVAERAIRASSATNS